MKIATSMLMACTLSFVPGAGAQTPSLGDLEKKIEQHKKDHTNNHAVVSPAFRFQESGSVIKDTKTGLEWMKSDNGSNINWNGANQYCNSQRGYWRLPTPDELQTIRDTSLECRSNGCTTSSKFKFTGPLFWSSERQGSFNSFKVFLETGDREAIHIDYTFWLRALCVRLPAPLEY